MTDLDPKHITLAKSLLAQDYTEAQAVTELIHRGVPADDAPRYVSQAVWRLKSDQDRLASYQRQALMAAAFGLVVIVFALSSGEVRGKFAALTIMAGPVLFFFSVAAWIISKFFADLALWFAERPVVIFAAVGAISLVAVILIQVIA